MYNRSQIRILPAPFVIYIVLVWLIHTLMQVVSNGKMKAVVHRVVTNASKARTTAVFFMSPTMDCIVEPAKAIVEAQDCGPLYKAFRYKEYFDIHTGHDGDRDTILESYNFKIKQSSIP